MNTRRLFVLLFICSCLCFVISDMVIILVLEKSKYWILCPISIFFLSFCVVLGREATRRGIVRVDISPFYIHIDVEPEPLIPNQVIFEEDVAFIEPPIVNVFTVV